MGTCGCGSASFGAGASSCCDGAGVLSASSASAGRGSPCSKFCSWGSSAAVQPSGVETDGFGGSSSHTGA